MSQTPREAIPAYGPTAGRRMHWSPRLAPSIARTREAAGLFDESSFAKLELRRPGAAELLERLCDNRAARDVGAITYTQMLNRRGGIECDFTVTRVEQEVFQIVTGTAFGNHDASWIRRYLPDDGSVRLTDVTSRWACFALWGPRAPGDPGTAHPPTRSTSPTCRCASSSSATSRCARCGSRRRPAAAGSCTAPLSTAWFLPLAVGRWETSRTAGGGYRAIDSMRLERATGCGPWTSPGRYPVPGGARLLRARRQGRSLGRTRPRRPSRAAACAAGCSRTCWRWPGQRAGPDRGSGRGPGYEWQIGYTAERLIAYAYLPRGGDCIAGGDRPVRAVGRLRGRAEPLSTCGASASARR